TSGASAPEARFTIAETQPASGTVGTGSSYHATPSGTVAPDCRLRICDLHPGEYELTLSEFRKGPFPGLLPFGTSIVTIGNRSVLYEPFRPGSAIGNAGLRITLARDGGTVGTFVADQDGHPAAECRVVVLPATAPSEAMLAAALRTGRTDQTGNWSSPTLA